MMKMFNHSALSELTVQKSSLLSPLSIQFIVMAISLFIISGCDDGSIKPSTEIERELDQMVDMELDSAVDMMAEELDQM